MLMRTKGMNHKREKICTDAIRYNASTSNKYACPPPQKVNMPLKKTAIRWTVHWFELHCPSCMRIAFQRSDDFAELSFFSFRRLYEVDVILALQRNRYHFVNLFAKETILRCSFTTGAFLDLGRYMSKMSLLRAYLENVIGVCRNVVNGMCYCVRLVYYNRCSRLA